MPAPYEETAAAPADSAAISHLPNTPVGKGRKAEADGNVLTSDDVVELTNFIKSKARIDEQIQLLESRPKIDVFEDFKSMADGAGSIAEATTELPAWRAQVREWQVERDEIEREAEDFDVEDMSRLRTVAKAASERHMSRQDTDLIEITLGTLFALDKLLQLLRTRQKLLDLLSSRLAWEEERAAAWSEYYLLAADLEGFVTRKARWSPVVYARGFDMGTATAAPSPSRDATPEENATAASESAKDSPRNSTRTLHSAASRHMLSEILSLDVARLTTRVRSLSRVLVATAGSSLDAIIDQCQVPDEFLDEQEKLEDLAGALGTQSGFVAELASQWRKADELYSLTRAVHSEAKELCAEIEKAKCAKPDLDRSTAFTARGSSLSSRLATICSPSLATFLADSSRSSTSLRFARQHVLPEPLHEAWPDQYTENSSANSILFKELASAAKRVRQALASSSSFERALRAYDLTTALQADLTNAAVSHDQIRHLALDGWTESGIEGDGTRPSFAQLTCIEPHAHKAYIQRFPSLLSQLADLETSTAGKVQELAAAVLECRREGLNEPSFRSAAEDTTRVFEASRGAAKAAIGESKSILGLLQLCRSFWESIGSVGKGCDEMRFEVTSASKSARCTQVLQVGNTPSTLAHLPPPAAFWAKLDALRRQGDACRTSLASIGSDPGIDGAAALLSRLHACRSVVGARMEELAALIRWYEALHRQSSELSATTARFEELRATGDELRAQLSPLAARDAPFVDTALRNPLPAPLTAGISEFGTSVGEFVSLMPDKVSFTGPRPALGSETWSNSLFDLTHQLGAGAQESPSTKAQNEESQDEEVRAVANQQCATLNSLKDELDALVRTIEENAGRASRNAQSQSRSQRFDDALEAAQDALQRAMADLEKRGEGFKDAHATVAASIPRSESLSELRGWRDQSRDVLMEHQRNINSKLDALRSCQQEMISSMYSTGKPVAQDGEVARTAAAVKVRNSAASFGRAVDRLLKSFDEGISSELKRREVSLEGTSTTTPSPVPSAAASRSGSPEEKGADVFGPTVVVGKQARSPSVSAAGPMPVASDPAEDALRARILALLQRLSGGVVEEQTILDGRAQMRRLLELPSEAQAAAAKSDFANVQKEAEAMLNDASAPKDECSTLQQALQKRSLHVRRFGLLAGFSQQAKACEEALSSFLDLIDGAPGRSLSRVSTSSNHSRPRSALSRTGDLPEVFRSKVAQRLDEVRLLVEECRSAGDPVGQDVRVRDRLTRLDQLWKDMSETAQDMLDPSRERQSPNGEDDFDDGASVASSSTSVAHSIESASGRETPTRTVEVRKAGFRSLNKMPRTPSVPSRVDNPKRATPRATMRAVSDSSSMRRKAAHVPDIDAAGPATPRQAPRTPGMVSSASMSIIARKASVSVSTPSTRTSQRKPSARQPNHYRPNPKSKLDIAVGRIVNRLPVPVSITQAPAGPAQRSQGTSWKDESGRYWVGDPDPKLCFCRILRSRTVMVRVGGGWTELSNYIMQHYAHLAASVAVATPTNSPLGDMDHTNLPWISSATFNKPSPNVTPEKPTGIEMAMSMSRSGSVEYHRKRVASVPEQALTSTPSSIPVLVRTPLEDSKSKQQQQQPRLPVFQQLDARAAGSPYTHLSSSPLSRQSPTSPSVSTSGSGPSTPRSALPFPMGYRSASESPEALLSLFIKKDEPQDRKFTATAGRPTWR